MRAVFYLLGSVQETIYAQIRKEQNEFYDTSIQVVPGYSFNQYLTLKRAHLYLNSKYEDGTQYMGRDKLFFNVVVPPCEVAMRMLNVDTKNIRLLPMNPKSYFSTYLLEKELKLWLKTNKMGRILNQIAEEAPRYGSVLLEKTKDGASVVDLRKLINDPTVDDIQDSRFVTTIHYMTPSQLRETGWDNVDVAIERFGESNAMQSFEDEYGNLNTINSTPYIKVWKRYGEVPQWWIDGGTSEKMVKALFIVAGAEKEELNSEGKPTGELGVILFKSRWHKKWPFKDFHYVKIKGRWLGMGVTEMLFDVQVRINELKNQKRISMELSAMHLFTTPDRTIVRNALTDLQNGDILISENGINPILNEERNLQAFDGEEQSYLAQADRVSFAYEAIRGDQNANTTLGQTQIAVAQGTSVYAFKKQNLEIFLQDFFNDLVMPQLMTDLTPDHIMRFTGSAQELQKLDEAAAEIEANDYIKEQIIGGRYVAPEELDLLKMGKINEYKKLGESRFLKLKKNFYSDVEFEFDFNIGNEQVEPTLIVQNTQAVFSALAQNPAILQDPRIKMLFFRFAEQLGVPPAEIELADQQASALEANQMTNGQIQGQQMAGNSQRVLGTKPTQQTASAIAP